MGMLHSLQEPAALVGVLQCLSSTWVKKQLLSFVLTNKTSKGQLEVRSHPLPTDMESCSWDLLGSRLFGRAAKRKAQACFS